MFIYSNNIVSHEVETIVYTSFPLENVADIGKVLNIERQNYVKVYEKVVLYRQNSAAVGRAHYKCYIPI